MLADVIAGNAIFSHNIIIPSLFAWRHSREGGLPQEMAYQVRGSDSEFVRGNSLVHAISVWFYSQLGCCKYICLLYTFMTNAHWKWHGHRSPKQHVHGVREVCYHTAGIVNTRARRVVCFVCVLGGGSKLYIPGYVTHFLFNSGMGGGSNIYYP